MEVIGSSGVSSSLSDDEAKHLSSSRDSKTDRIRSRRERIQKRVEHNEQDDRGDEATLRPPLAKDCLEKTAHELYRLEVESEEMISNVRVANEAKEVTRRKQDQEDRRRRMEILDEESRQAQAQFEEISSRWSEISKMNDPLNIHNECEAQRLRCTELLDQKNNMIRVLKEDLERCDENYREDMISQNEDTSLLIQRIEQQMKLLRKAYWFNLDLLQNAIHAEFKEYLEEKQNIWNRLYKKRNKLEKETVEEKIEKQKLYDEQLQELRLSFEDEFRQKKIEYEKQIQDLQLELEQLKPNCLHLKLAFEYNFTLVQKRVEENLHIHSQQKRRNNKLNDLVAALRQKTKQSRENFERDVKKLKDDIAKLNAKKIKIESISKQLYQENEIKYRQLWNLNEKEAELHLQKILQTDKTIYEQFLGMNWEPPASQLFKKEDLFPPKKISSSKLDNLLQRCPQISIEPESKRRRMYECVKQALTSHCDFLNDPTVNSIVETYGAKTETLVKLNNILDNLGIASMEDINVLVDFMKPYIFCTQCKEQLSRTSDTVSIKVLDDQDVKSEITEIALIHSKRLDTITPFIQSYELDFADFDKVETETSIVLPDIVSPPSRTSSSYKTVSGKSKTSFTRAKSLSDILAQSNLSLIVDTKVVDRLEVIDVHELDVSSDYFKTEFTCSIQWNDGVTKIHDITNARTVDTRPLDKTVKHTEDRKQSDESVKETLVPFICANDSHQLSIESSDVLNALQQFIKNYKNSSHQRGESTNNSQPNISREKRIDKGEVEKFWKQYLKMFPEEKLELWSSVFKSLEKYYQVLIKRQKLNEELDCLSSRNKHLRTLLQCYIKPEAEHKSNSLPPIHTAETAKNLSSSNPFPH